MSIAAVIIVMYVERTDQNFVHSDLMTRAAVTLRLPWFGGAIAAMLGLALSAVGLFMVVEPNRLLPVIAGPL